MLLLHLRPQMEFGCSLCGSCEGEDEEQHLTRTDSNKNVDQKSLESHRQPSVIHLNHLKRIFERSFLSFEGRAKDPPPPRGEEDSSNTRADPYRLWSSALRPICPPGLGSC